MNTGKRDQKKTKDYLRSLGYTTEYVETLRLVGPAHNIPVKKDLFGADGLAFNNEKIFFWNSTTRAQIAAHVREFRKFVVPEFVDQYVVVWTPRDPVPTFIDAKTYKIRGEL